MHGISHGRRWLKRQPETSDRSAAIIDPEVKLKPSPYPKVLNEIGESPVTLKPAETDDRSKPIIEDDVTLKPAPMPALTEEIKSKAEDVVEFASRSALRHATQELVAEISQPAVTLKAAETDDRSAAVIDPDVKLKPSPFSQVVNEIGDALVTLKPAEMNDRSKPIIDDGTGAKPAPMPALTEEIKSKAEDVVEFASRSRVRSVSQELVAEISQPAVALKAAETDDRSAAVIDPDVKLKPSPFPQVVNEIGDAPVTLKPAETDDRSKPIIEADVTVKPAPMPALSEEIKGAVWVERA
jgi:ABC-type Zn uptake system ZnuABC Zn-binding protein ZnuA